jgi:hypothetical protein
MGAVSVVYDLTETKQGTWGGGRHHRRAFLTLQRGGLGGGGDCQSPCMARKENGPHIFAPPDIRSKGGARGNCVWLRQGPHATGCSAGENQGGGRKCGPLLGGSPHMGSGSFLSRKTLVQFPDFFLISPQFLHRAFSLSNKVNKCQ